MPILVIHPIHLTNPHTTIHSHLRAIASRSITRVAIAPLVRPLTFSCQQILTSNQPSTQDSHGCPFRHFSPDSLSSFLIQTYPHSFDRSSQELREVMDQVKSTHYHLACTRVFEVVKGVKKGEGLGGENVVHPNKWVDASRAMEK
jgi:DNA primase large subunit